MELLVIVGLVVLNLAISWWNAVATGHMWLESKAAGGFARLYAWCGAIMSACGFTWCYTIIMVGIGGLWPWNEEQLPMYQSVSTLFLETTYLAIIFPILITGYIITAESWVHFWRHRNLGSAAGAGWNTFASIYNTANALDSIPKAGADVIGAFFKGDNKNAATIAFGLALLALLGGALTTAAIMRNTIEKTAGRVRSKFG